MGRKKAKLDLLDESKLEEWLDARESSNITTMELFDEIFQGSITLRPWQEERLKILFDPLLTDTKNHVWQRMALAGAHGIGKTTFDCIVMVMHLYYCATYEPDRSYRGIVIAGKEQQLKEVVWAELRQVVDLTNIPFMVTSRYLNLGDKFRINGVVVDKNQPQKIQGSHAENMLVIIDEAGAVDDSAFDRVKTFFTDARGILLATANPYITFGAFYLLFNNPGWQSHHIARDITNTKDLFIKEVLDEFGEDSDAYRVKVLGLFPMSEPSAFFPRFLVENAINREYIKNCEPPYCFGIDVASGEGADYSTLVVRNGVSVIEIIRVKVRFSEFKGIIMGKYRQYRPIFIGIDSVGLGCGLFQELYDQIHRSSTTKVHGVVGNSSTNRPGTHDRRTALMFALRDWLAHIGNIPDDENLKEELKSIRVEPTASGKVKTMSKKDMNTKSPDIVDALIYSFADHLEEPIRPSEYSNRKSLWGY